MQPSSDKETAMTYGQTLRAAPLAALLLASPALADGDVVVMKDFDFAPMALTVSAGTTVTWKNLDGEPHTIVSADGAFRSKALDEDDSFSFKFDKPGVYKYLCSIHSKMVGTVTVK
jgi:plastocyanin